ncbi:MAG: LytTR family DNA-binding domain-containing protein [Bacteroidota bacterium]
MNPMRAILVDDEEDSREIVKHYLQEHFPTIRISAEADTVQSALAAIQQHDFELLFLDIQLPDGNGFDLLKQLPNFTFDVIFITAHTHYALPAIKAHALDYLVKPLDRAPFRAAVETFLQKKAKAPNLQTLLNSFLQQTQETQITLPTLTGFKVVNTNEIIRLESNGNYTLVHCMDGSSTLVSKPLKVYEKALPIASFCRIHHSHIVNIYCIKEYIRGRGGQVILQDGSTLSVSENKRKVLLKYWQKE